MKARAIFIFLNVMLIAIFSFAEDLGFRYQNGACVNNKGEKGYNPSFFGPCSDLRGTTLHGLSLENTDFSGSLFVAVNLQKVSFKNSILTGVNFESSVLTGVKFDEARVQKVNFQQATLKNVTFSEAVVQESQFINVDLRGNDMSYARFETNDFTGADFSQTQLSESQFIGCNLTDTKFEKADLRKGDFTDSLLMRTKFSGAQMENANLSSLQGEDVAFIGSNLKKANFAKSKILRGQFGNALLTEANLSGSDFTQSNMRGTDLTNVVYEDALLKDVTYTVKTKLPFSDEIAKSLGMLRVNTKTTLILWDEMSTYVNDFAKGLETVSGGEIEIVMSPTSELQFSGQFSLVDYDSIIHLNGKDGASADSDLPDAGQTALVQYVQNGGNFIYGEWQAYAVSRNRYRLMRDLILFQRQSDTEGTVQITFNAEGMKHPLFKGLTNPVSFNSGGTNIGTVITFANNPVTLLASDASQRPAIATRRVGSGQVIGFSFTCTYQQSQCLNEEVVRRLYTNAILSH